MAFWSSTYLLCIEGGIHVIGHVLHKYDTREIEGGGLVEIKAVEVSPTENGNVTHLLMYAMPEEPDSNRLDFYKISDSNDTP